jgi:hypothetical protein
MSHGSAAAVRDGEANCAGRPWRHRITPEKPVSQLGGHGSARLGECTSTVANDEGSF